MIIYNTAGEKADRINSSQMNLKRVMSVMQNNHMHFEPCAFCSYLLIHNRKEWNQLTSTHRDSFLNGK